MTLDTSASIFSISGTEGFRLTSTTLYTASGINVGIGTSSPAGRLEVKSPNTSRWWLEDDSSATNTKMVFTNSAGTVNRARYQASEHYWQVSGVTDAAILNSSGNLGLGVTPSAWSSGGNITLADNKAIGAAGQYLNLSANWYYSGGDKYVGNGYATLYYQQVGAHKWYTAPNNTSGAGATLAWTTAMTLDASGNLLVGGTSQNGTANRVAVFSANKFGLSVIDTTAQALGVGGALNLGGNYRAAGDAQAFCRVEAAKENSTDNNFAYAMAFSTTANGGSITERARISSDGTFRVKGAGTAGSTDAFLVDGAAPASAARITSGGDFLFGVTAFANNKLCVAIRGETTGATDESIRCAVPSTSSTLQIGFYNSNGRVGSVSTDGSNTAFNTSSDRRLKENICLADEAGNVIDSIEVVKHDWKVGGHTRYGVIAQDLHKVAPEAVTPGDNGEKVERAWGVDYSKLVPMLVKEIQSLRARVAQLESK